MFHPIIEIKEKEAKFFNKEGFVPSGSYIVVSTQKVYENVKEMFFRVLSNNDKDKGIIHAMIGHSYYALLPNYEYIYRYFNGMDYIVNEELDGKHNSYLLTKIIEKINVREWQKNVVNQIKNQLDKGLKYKKGLNIPVGAGKTLLALILCEYAKRTNKSCLFLTEKHLIKTVQEEAKNWSLALPTTLINYDNVKIKKTIVGNNYDIIIVDECLKFKSGGNQIFKRLREICDKADIVICCTGTVTSGRDIADLSWLNLLGDIVPNHFDIWAFMFGINTVLKRYKTDVFARNKFTNRRELKECIIPKIEFDGWKWNNIIDLLKPYLYSPIIKDIALPELIEEKVFFSKPQYYGAVRAGNLGVPAGSNYYQLLEATSGFVSTPDKKIIPLEPEKTAKMVWILNWLDANPNKQLIVFSFYVYEQELLIKYFKKNNISFCLNTCKKKESEKFIEKKARVLICSSQMTEGLNLQKNCDTCVFLSYSSHPVKMAQGIGRIKRQGQKSPLVRVYHLLCNDTEDLRMLLKIEKHLEHLTALNEKSAI